MQSDGEFNRTFDHKWYKIDAKVKIYRIFLKVLSFDFVLSFYKTFVRKLFYYFNYTGLLPLYLGQSLLKILGVLS